MNATRLYISFVQILKLIVRRRIIPVLLIVIPSAFFYVVYLTTSTRIIPFEVASVANEFYIEVSERNSSFVFFAVASVGFLSSYMGLILIQNNFKVNRRLIICGYNPLEILLSNFAVLLAVILFVAGYICLSLLLFFPPSQLFNLFIGLVMSGVVYGCYGFVVGSLIKGELEGILLIVLLANIDAGWLQNPLFYSEAQNQVVIRFLPAYFPSQMAIISAFSNHGVVKVFIGAVSYGAALSFMAHVIYYYKMKKL